MPTNNEFAVELATSNIRFGPGVTREIGMDLADQGIGRVMVATDPHLKDMLPVHTVLESLEAAEKLEKEGIQAEVVDLRTLNPLDLETVIKSVKKTGKAVVVHEACKTGGFGGEVAAQAGDDAELVSIGEHPKTGLQRFPVDSDEAVRTGQQDPVASPGHQRDGAVGR